MILSLFLIFLGLPGTWVIIGIVGLWAIFNETSGLGWSFFLPLIALAAFGELAEFFAGHIGTKRFGGSTRGSVGGMIGALIGAIFCAPLFFGFGALLGALGGGFLGCFIVEKLSKADNACAARAAWGATLGRFGGFVIKLGVGIGIIWYSLPRIFAGA